MRIGYDGTCLANRRGFGRFARQLLSAFVPIATARGHEVIVAIDGPSASDVDLPEGVVPMAVDVRQSPAVAASARGRRGLRDMVAMGRAVSRADLDLMYFPATYSFYPVWSVPRLVVTMHDTLTLEHPKLVFPTWTGRVAWTLKERLAIRSADRIVTVSETSKRYLKDRLQLRDDEIRIVSEAADQVFRPLDDPSRAKKVLARYGIPTDARYLLYVGGLSPHKNLPRLVNAFARCASTDVRLVLTGDFHDVFHTHVPEIRAAISRAGVADRVVLPGFVPDDDLAAMYGRAYALVFPSLLEGFGLPAVEAMACGTPVAASRAGSLPEVVGDAGIYFDPHDEADMTRALDALLLVRPLRDALAAKALSRAAAFGWDASARSLLACFEELRPSPAPRNRSSRLDIRRRAEAHARSAR